MSEHEVVRLELELLQPDRRGDRAYLERVLHPDFEEFGSSGRHWHRDEIIAALLAQPGSSQPEATDFRMLDLGPDSILLTYRTRTSLRSSIWVRGDTGWLIRFHQGTPHISPGTPRAN